MRNGGSRHLELFSFKKPHLPSSSMSEVEICVQIKRSLTRFPKDEIYKVSIFILILADAMLEIKSTRTHSVRTAGRSRSSGVV